MEESTPRVIAHFDVDCFYAQAEILKRPSLEERPVGVTQKFLVVTCNYVARRLGVPKMATIQEAKMRCPDLVLFNGEDLTPYRAASKEIMKVLGRFGTVERCGLDEAAVDITEEVRDLSRRGSFLVKSFSGHVIGLESNCVESLEDLASQISDPVVGDQLLMVGTQLVAEMRATVKKETGFRCSCGIANNKMLAKLVSSVNKPDNQTCILQSAISTFLDPLPVRKIPGVGHQMELLLKEIQVETVADLKDLNACQLCAKFGKRIGTFLYNACRGVDHSNIIDKGPPKSISVENSFRSCTSLENVEKILQKLAPDLLVRLDEDREETGRRPRTITVKWRQQGSWNFTSVSAHMPVEVLATTLPVEKRQETMVTAAMKLVLHRFTNSTFCIVVLNLGATNFVKSQSAEMLASHDIRSLLQNSKSLKCEEKTARIYSEAREPSKDVQKQCLSGSEESQIVRESDVYAANMEGCVFSLQKPHSNTETNVAGHDVSSGQFSTVSMNLHIGATHEGMDTILDQEFESRSGADGLQEDRCIVCEKCGQRLDGDQKSVQEHGDYHYALELEHHGRSFLSTMLRDNISKDKSKLSVRQTSSFSRKYQKGTLDAFVFQEK